ncbi:MAG: MAPEG family protein [Proteobacteria bacterium]|uniref:MAPEG family protein n=1 Tax=Aquabacterium sp. TaxID=1872578 RepID=UPI0035C760F5|nr:MAPEG family protein [Pseudomonadota bacterium]
MHDTHDTHILLPVFALAGWTALVLLLIPFVRVRAGRRREIVPDDFKYGESAAVPPHVQLPNRNYMNLLELPVLFYVISILLHVSGPVPGLLVALAWSYVGLRVLHSLIHLSYNHVIHRLAAFAASNVVLVLMWVLAGMHLLGARAGS